MSIHSCMNVTMTDEVYIGNQIGGKIVGPGLTSIDQITDFNISNFNYTANVVSNKSIGLLAIGALTMTSPLSIGGFVVENNECDEVCDRGMIYIENGMT